MSKKILLREDIDWHLTLAPATVIGCLALLIFTVRVVDGAIAISPLETGVTFLILGIVVGMYIAFFYSKHAFSKQKVSIKNFESFLEDPETLSELYSTDQLEEIKRNFYGTEFDSVLKREIKNRVNTALKLRKLREISPQILSETIPEELQ